MDETPSANQSLDELKALNTLLDNNAKLLIRRDLELNRANEALRKIDRVKSEFVSRVTHQLRTPLSGAKWALWMLICGEMGQLTEDQRVFIMKIYESNERMVALINELLEADKLENGTAQFEIQETSLVDLLQNLLEEIKIVGQRHKVDIQTEIDPDIPHIPIDPKSIRSVFQNVIENAIKYSHANSAIRIELRNRENAVEFIVADHGIGIPKDEQKNIFTRFYRSANAVRFVTDSSGLGLYIVATVVKRHNGTIRFESEENVGTTFFITLPKKPQPTV